MNGPNGQGVIAAVNTGQYSEIYYGRDQILRDTGTDFALPIGTTFVQFDYHLIIPERPIIIRGYHIAGATNCTSGTLARLWIQAGDPANSYLPAGAAIGDTGSAGFNLGGMNAAILTNGDRYLDVMLSQVARIDPSKVGLPHWIGIMHQEPASAGNYRGQLSRGNAYGMRDLKVTAAGMKPTNANFATFTIPTSFTSSDIECASDNRTANLAVGLILDRR